MNVTVAERMAADAKPRGCQFETGFAPMGASTLCGDPAVMIVDRLDRGRLALCSPHADAIWIEVDRESFAVSMLVEREALPL